MAGIKAMKINRNEETAERNNGGENMAKMARVSGVNGSIWRWRRNSAHQRHVDGMAGINRRGVARRGGAAAASTALAYRVK